MIKNLTLIARRADHDREQFREHYEETHAPLALRHIHVFDNYVRNHVADELGGGTPAFDVCTEFWFADGEAAKTVMTVLESPVGEEIRADEKSFMDRSSITSIPVSERVVSGPDRNADVGATRKVVAFLRRPEGVDPDTFVQDLERGPLARLLETAPPVRCTVNQALALPGPEPPFDCVAMLWYAAGQALPEAVRGWRPAAGSFVLLGVHEDETPRERLRG